MVSRIQLASLFVVVAAVCSYYVSLVVILYDPTPQFVPNHVDLLSATTHHIQALLQNGTVTSVQLVSEYQRRIARDNRAGFWLNAILDTAPNKVLEVANQRDAQRKKGKSLGPLHGVPFVVKDTMVTDPKLGMKTTYGAYALQNSSAPVVAFIIQKAEEAGAIVLGKTNPQELGGYKGFNNAGWSKVGGRTVSPFDFGEPCGSSSGSGVAVSAGFAPIALATDTTGSVTCPAAFNGAYGLRPTIGLLSRTGILPTTTSFDTPGVIAKSVADIATWMNVLAQPDTRDPMTLGSSVKRSKNYSRGLEGGWQGMRIGVLDRAAFWNESKYVWSTEEDDRQMIRTCNETMRHFEKLGATVIENIAFPLAHMPEQHPALYFQLLYYELKRNLNTYLATLKNTSIHSLGDLVAFNRAHPDLADDEDHPGQEWLEGAMNSTISEQRYLELQEQRKSLVKEQGVEYILNQHGLDAVVVPAFTELAGANAISGTPFGVVPVGQYSFGRPYALGFAVRRFDDELLLRIMAAAEASLPPPPIPDIYKYKSFLDKARYWWRRLRVPSRSPDNRFKGF